jgi:hypothetical protein
VGLLGAGCAGIEPTDASDEAVGSSTDAIHPSPNFNVDFADCTEFAGIALIP